MKPIAFLFLAVCCLFAGEHSNRRAPGFSLMDTHFEQHDMQDYKGKIVLLDFMKTDCPVCNNVADTLVDLKSRYGNKIEIVSVVSSPDSFDTVEKFAALHKAKWPILFDSGQVMMSYLELKPTGNMNVHFPHVFLIDGTGMIRNDFDGGDPSTMATGALSVEIDNPAKIAAAVSTDERNQRRAGGVLKSSELRSIL